jgi:hypothetical protein
MVLRRALAVLVILLFAWATGAQASVRPAVSLPVTVAVLAEAAGSRNTARSLILLDVLRIVFNPQDASHSRAIRQRVTALLSAPPSGERDTVPLPLPPSVWREIILQAPIEDDGLIGAIVARRDAALLYYGLSAMDDETLTWLAGDRETLAHLQRRPGAVAAFGRSVRVRDGQVVVPGGPDAAAFWRGVVGADPARPGAFLRGLFRSDRGRLAYLYDTIAHLDAPRQRFALGRPGAIAKVFRHVSHDWDPELRPFARPQLDPSLVLGAITVTAEGQLAGPGSRALWERVFRDDFGVDVAFREVAPWKAAPDDTVDAGWLAHRITTVPYPVGRRRLDALLFAQRALDGARGDAHVQATILRGLLAMPALVLTMERAGVTDPATLVAGVRHAHALDSTIDGDARADAATAFQCAVGFVERGARSRALAPAAVRPLLESLFAIPVDGGRGYERRLAEWITAALAQAAAPPAYPATDPVEDAVLRLIAGGSGGAVPSVEWEGSRYRVDPGAAELARLHRVRERQRGSTIDAAVARVLDGADGARDRRDRLRLLASTLASVLYAAHLGDPEGPALSADNVALRHDLGFSSSRPGVRPMTAWRIPSEVFGGREGWHVQGSMLGLDMALRKLALRRMDAGEVPTGSRLPLLERQTAMLTAAFSNPHSLTDADLDRVAGALARGRAAVDALQASPADADDVARRAGLSAWRREALRWALVHAPAEARAFSLVETYWVGGGSAIDAWGAAATPMTGCLCLAMPAPTDWESLMGRPAAGLIATLGADVNLLIAAALAERKLPAALMPGVLAFAMQDVLDQASPAFLDDWPAFWRAATEIPPERIDDYIAALTAGGPLVPVRGTE